MSFINYLQHKKYSPKTIGKYLKCNGSFEGTANRSNYHAELIATNSSIEGFIHTHPTQRYFSKHSTIEDKNQVIDENFMNESANLYTDFYLVNRQHELLVSRRAEQMMSNPGTRGDPMPLVSGLTTPKMFFHLNSWQGPDGKPLKPGNVPEAVKNFINRK